MRFGLDSTSMVPIAAHHAVGSSFAVRYLSRFAWKSLKAAEVPAYRAAGIDLVLVFEDFADDALKGFQQGLSNGSFVKSALAALGLPANMAVHYAVDFDAKATQQPAIDEYFRGINQVRGLGATRSYCGYWPGKRLLDAGRVSGLWQTYAWSGRNLDPRASLFQYSNGHTVGGVGVDFNHALKADFGQLTHGPVPKPSAPEGVATAEISWDLKRHRLKVRPTKGKNVRWSDHELTAHLPAITLDVGGKHAGQWHVK